VARFVIKKEGFKKWGLAIFLHFSILPIIKMGPVPFFEKMLSFYKIFASITKKLPKKMGKVAGFVPK